jgi:hypothetical protein
MAPTRDDDTRSDDAPAGNFPAATSDAPDRRPRRFRRGDEVEIRSLAEIAATLDAEGKLDGLPFLPEMQRFCGGRFRVHSRAERIYLDHFYYIARLKNTVLLESVRCDGAAHADCQMNCLLFWKEAWLKPGNAESRESRVESLPDFDPRPSTLDQPDTTERFCCQATELVRAARRLRWWDIRQYVRDLRDGEQTPGQLLCFFVRQMPKKLGRMLGRSAPLRSPGSVAAAEVSLPAEKLDLQPGDWVEIKSLAEIHATLDAQARHRGLGFAPEMARYCGRRFRVAYRIDRVILEWSGQMRRIRDTVALEDAICDGQCCRNCPRSCYLFWREAWLRKVEG